MSDEAPERDTPQAGPEGTPGEQAQIDWEKRYNDLRPKFDQTTQRLSQAEQDAQNWKRLQEDENYQTELLQQLGYQVEPADEPDPGEQYATELQQLRERLDQRDQQESEARRLATVEAHVDAALSAIKDLDNADKDWIVARAVTLDPTGDGMPDIQAAYQALVERDVQAQKRWAKTKQTQHFSPSGQPGTDAPDLDKMSRSDLAAWMAEQVQMADQQ